MQKMTRKLIAIAGIVGITVCVLAAAPVAQADGLGGISGWQPPPPVCGNQNQIPILITNASQAVQTGSITVNDNLAANVQVYSSQAAMTAYAPDCTDTVFAGQGYSYNFTVQPGTTAVYWAALGGVDSNDYKGSQNIAIGGLPSGTAGASWFDFNLNLTSLLGFGSMQVQYDNTGGTDSTTSGQNNFNVIPCWNQNGNVDPGDGILTPFSSGYTTGPTYYFGDPVCLGWMPEGQMVSFTNGGIQGWTMTAAQQNTVPSGSNTLDFAGTFTGPIPMNSMSYVVTYQGQPSQIMYEGNIPISESTSGVNTTSMFAFYDGDKWGVANIPLPPVPGTVQLYLNGGTYLLGSADFDGI